MSKKFQNWRCDCEYWQTNFTDLSVVHDKIGELGFSGFYFKYCPYCGRKLKLDDEEKKLEKIFNEEDQP